MFYLKTLFWTFKVTEQLCHAFYTSKYTCTVHKEFTVDLQFTVYTKIHM